MHCLLFKGHLRKELSVCCFLLGIVRTKDVLEVHCFLKHPLNISKLTFFFLLLLLSVLFLGDVYSAFYADKLL